MKVMGARALIRKLEYNPTPTGLIQPVKLTDEPSQYAEIVAVGSVKTDKATFPLDIKPGDKVFTKMYCGAPAQINNETLYFVEYEDILAVIE